MKIPNPPKIKALFEEVEPTQLFGYMEEFKATDERGHYLSWDKFKYTYTKDTKTKWLAVKLNRSSLMNHLLLNDFNFSFCVPDSLQGILHFIDKSTGGNIGTSNLTGFSKGEQNKFLLKSLIIEEAITSAQLEGAVTTRKVAKEMLKTERKPTNKDEIMILNNYYLMKEVIKLIDKPLSIEMILKLHQIATDKAINNKAVAGEFRKNDEIYIADYDGNIIHRPPSYEKLNDLMIAFCDFVNTNHSNESDTFIHPTVKAIIIHFLIGFIHPFGDGNGRTARALFYWFMLKNGYWLFEYVSISRLLKQAPKKYAMAYLNTETDDLNITYFLYYQADIIKRSITDLENYIADKQKRFNEFVGEVAKFTARSTKKINNRQIQILQKAVKESGYIFTVKEICNEYDVSENTARKDLKALSQLNLLGTFKNGNTTAYISPSDLLERLKAL
ncbi:Fic family protein [Pasteurella atlantica]|uniref:Fic family protein n=1 Tax=Phocoenobacter atlanticus TaxID=3416742 RepID=UPI00274B4BF1|nr:Fic family protein [Pasteurella atlantica]MDP8042704.1 Fic family protein [Pasteurella atlantica]